MQRTLAAMAVLFVAGQAPAETYLYVADHNTGKVIKIKYDGTLAWDAPNGNGHDVQVLPNRNVLINHGGVVEEVAPDHKVVWSVGRPVVASAESVQRLPNGNTVIADNGRMKVIEIDRDKKVVWEFPVPNDNKRPSPTMRQVRRLANGNTLVCASTEDKVIEVSPDKKVVWSYAVPFPYLATRLPSGNTLISSGDGYGSPRGYFVVEVSPEGKPVWKYGGDDAPADQKLQWPSGHVRLASGNTLIAEARAGVIREVSPDKRVLRVIRSPAMKHPATIAVVEEDEAPPRPQFNAAYFGRMPRAWVEILKVDRDRHVLGVRTRKGEEREVPIRPDTELRVRDSWGDLSDYYPGESVMLFVYHDAAGQWVYPRAVQDEIQMTSLHKWWWTVDALAGGTVDLSRTEKDKTFRESFRVGSETKVWKGDKPAGLEALKTGDVVLFQTRHDKGQEKRFAVELLDAKGLEAIKAAQQARHRQRLTADGLPAVVNELDVLTGAVRVSVQWAAIDLAKAIKRGDRVSVARTGDNPIKLTAPVAESQAEAVRHKLLLAADPAAMIHLRVGDVVRVHLP